jgi:hypothetical protein
MMLCALAKWARFGGWSWSVNPLDLIDSSIIVQCRACSTRTVMPPSVARGSNMNATAEVASNRCPGAFAPSQAADTWI